MPEGYQQTVEGPLIQSPGSASAARKNTGKAIVLAVGLGLCSPLLLSLQGCQSVYYSAMEKVGFPKREILQDRVENARESQEDAKEEFSSALEQFQVMFGKQDSDLQEKYDKLSSAFEDSENAAEEVRSRIDKVEDVAGALFEEWEEELDIYDNDSLKAQSAKQLKTTRAKYKTLVAAMKKAESKMEPVLAVFRDQVLYLKHNLNAQAISGLKTELGKVQTQVNQLIVEMNKSIKEADSFIADLNAS